jgi:hypothetical protein
MEHQEIIEIFKKYDLYEAVKDSLDLFDENHWQQLSTHIVMQNFLKPGPKKFAENLADTISKILQNIDEQLDIPKSLDVPATQFPLWPEEQRRIPNCFLRTSLFRATRRLKESIGFINKQLSQLPTNPAVKIFFRGEHLDQGDLEVYEVCLSYARLTNLGDDIHFTSYEILKKLGRLPNGREYKRLDESIMRLTGGIVKVQINNIEFFGNLLYGGCRNLDTGDYVIQINPKLQRLYQKGWTAINLEQRKLLVKHPLAQWLHNYYSSLPPGTKIANVLTLYERSGVSKMPIPEFRRSLKKALQKLKDIDFINDFSVVKDDVTVDIFTVNSLPPKKSKELLP